MGLLGNLQGGGDNNNSGDGLFSKMIAQLIEQLNGGGESTSGSGTLTAEELEKLRSSLFGSGLVGGGSTGMLTSQAGGFDSSSFNPSGGLLGNSVQIPSSSSLNLYGGVL